MQEQLLIRMRNTSLGTKDTRNSGFIFVPNGVEMSSKLAKESISRFFSMYWSTFAQSGRMLTKIGIIPH